MLNLEETASSLGCYMYVQILCGVTSSDLYWMFGPSQAYDGHMNLILSDVEETIMIVDVAEGAPEGQGTVNVRLLQQSIIDLVILT